MLISLAHYLSEKQITFLKAKSRYEAIKALVDTLQDHPLVQDLDLFHDAVLEREKMVSTAIGMGVAISHAKLPFYNDFFILVGILQQGVDWDAPDEMPVRIVFLVGGPDDKQTEYLQILSFLTLSVKNEQNRKAILQAKSKKELLKFFQQF